MKHLIIAALSLTSVTTPAVADRHCRAPEPDTKFFEFLDYPAADRENQLQAFLLTRNDYLYDQQVRNLEVCRTKGAEYDYNCDAPAFGEMGDINSDYLGLSEEEFLEVKDENRLRALEMRDALAACRGDG